MKKATGTKKRLLLWIGIPLLLLVGTFIFLISGLNSFLKPTIKRALERVVVNGSDSLYQFSIKDYNVGSGGRSATVTGIEVHIDTVQYQKLKAMGALPRLIIDARVDKLTISGLSAWQLWRHKNVICRGIELTNVKMSLLQQTKPADSLKNPSTKTFYELIKPDINNININSITLTNADIVYRTVQQQTAEKTWWHFTNTGVRLDDIRVDSLSHQDTARLWYAGNLKVALGAFNMTSSDGVYKLSTKNTEYDFKQRTATIEDFKLLPAISKQAFNKKKGYAADLFTVVVPSISIASFNASTLLIDSKIEAETVTIEEPDIIIYKDNTAPYDNRNKVGKYPQQLLIKDAPPIDIRSIKISKGKLKVTQKGRKSGEEGSFNFQGVAGAITNVTNDSLQVKKNNWCKADLTAGFMGANKMRGVFAFDLTSSNGHFTTDASLQSLEASQINPTFRALARAELQSFHLEELQYHVDGYDRYAVGNLRMRYRDLKLNVLKEDDDGDLQKKGLISLLANLLKIYDHNPMPGNDERKATGIRDERLPEKNFFGLIVRTLVKCAQEVTLKGKNKQLPGLSGKKPATKTENTAQEKAGKQASSEKQSEKKN